MSAPESSLSSQILWALFKKQDEALQDHLASTPLARDAFDLVSEAGYLGIRILQALPFAPAKCEVIIRFVEDTMSAAFVSARVALWGDFPEAMAILRCAIERSAQLMYIVGESKYQVARYEMDQGSLERVGYDAAVSAMGDVGKRIAEVHGRISEAAAHATAGRLQLTQYEYDGKQFARIGVSHNPTHVIVCLYYCAQVFLIMLDRLRASYVEEGLVTDAVESIKLLTDRFSALTANYRQELLRQGFPVG